MNQVPYPLRPEELTVEFLAECPYTTFVGAINQWNVPPGAYDTLSRWRIFGSVDSDSDLLEIACTTGFSSRELARLSGCRAQGVDISHASIQMAKYNRMRYGPENVEYEAQDAMVQPEVGSYTHIVVGAAGRFFEDEAAMVDRCTQLLRDEGMLLASPFFAQREVPAELIQQCHEVFGIEITTQPYEEVLRPYRGFEVLYEQRMQLRPEQSWELDHYVESTVQRFSSSAGVTDAETLRVVRQRLHRIREMSNRLREFQAYAVLVLGYRTLVYPDRFVERF